jgi:predicted lipoprotein
MRILLAAMLALAPLSAHAANAMVERVTTGFILPAYQAFAAEGESMGSAMQALCAEPSDRGLGEARSHFLSLVTSWSRVELIRFGPVTAENRIDRVLFWPDRKGIGLRQVQAALAKQEAADLQSLAGKSVAMQGLGALEFVLFGTESEALAKEKESFRCRYGQAIAGNLAAIGTAVVKEWQGPNGFAALWTNPGPDNALYRDDTEALNELVDIFVHGLEQTRDVRINGFLGAEPAKDNPRTAIYRRSEATLLSLKANMEGLRDLFAVADFPAILPDDQDWIADSVNFEFANAGRALADAAMPVDLVLAEPERRGRLDYLRVVTSSLSNFFGVNLAAALGLTAGFSSLDGD